MIRNICLAVVFAAVSLAQAVGQNVIVHTNGFEEPVFSAATIKGQAGWLEAGNPEGASGIIQQEVVHTGEQSLRVDRIDVDHRWGVPVTGFPRGRFVNIMWDMAVTLNPEAASFGPFFGMEAYDAHINFGLLGSFGVDAATGELLYQEQDTGFLTVLPQTVESNVWNRYQLELDFQTDTYTALFNGIPLVTTGFVDRRLGLDEFSDADISTLAAAADSLKTPGTAFYDNIVVYDGLAGDFNADDVVDLDDYTLWRESVGADSLTNPDFLGDGNGDGVVDIFDLDVWVANFGRSNTITATSGAFSSVPESFLPLETLFLLTLAVLRDRRRRRSK